MKLLLLSVKPNHRGKGILFWSESLSKRDSPWKYLFFYISIEIFQCKVLIFCDVHCLSKCNKLALLELFVSFCSSLLTFSSRYWHTALGQSNYYMERMQLVPRDSKDHGVAAMLVYHNKGADEKPFVKGTPIWRR